ncbi:MAG TPA: YggS family pyridoxal phosphate-dependent enzyme [Desulfovibrio sp.]|jgi:pyridoxal phosphate enzyme (YggS family)|uniref:YggS family pyridoxal phosphate-dependent enzyme n=1 Tax=Desulfovibrio TaxID=872 RepID=UPI002A4D425D|nr:YggS family pyridoxal phosphate-dependent enzyme [Desulfovibrio sp.]MDY0307222.1 YggS family pyridoxal phosphate-dependent enzyme [Desulfovibrionaceae bacterium]HMM39628.1 YggS family pyridoxal phosphate-dependent enzyme [Desulfovibrio sp.]
MELEERARQLAENLARVREDMAEAARLAGRAPAEVALVAISKMHPASDVAALFAAGQRVFGESYAQEAKDKREELAHLPIEWHFVGGLQRNKAKLVAGECALIHAVDSLRLAEAVDRKAAERGVVQDVLLQVNSAGEEQKHGVSEAELPALAEAVAAMPALRLKGLMVLPPFFDDPERARPFFARARELKEDLERRLSMGLPHLSMGMTGDFAAAIAEGATLVRIGTRIFGQRDYSNR